MEENLTYGEVHISHFDDIKRIWCVDAWRTADDNEEGVVVANIHIDGTIEWLVDEAYNDAMVNEEIANFRDEYLFPNDDEIFEKFTKILNEKFLDDDIVKMTLISPDGETTYAIQHVKVFDEYDRYFFGLWGLDTFDTENDLHEAIDVMFYDFSAAVGDNYVIYFE